MRRTMDISAGGVRMEYVKGRRSLRLTTSNGDEPVEVPLSQLVEQLDIDRSLRAVAGRRHHPAGRGRHLRLLAR